MLADTSIKVVLEILFLSFSNADIEFVELEKLTGRSYTITKALLTTSWVELIDKKKLAKAALDENFETFVVHISALEAITIHFSRTTQIATL